VVVVVAQLVPLLGEEAGGFEVDSNGCI